MWTKKTLCTCYRCVCWRTRQHPSWLTTPWHRPALTVAGDWVPTTATVVWTWRETQGAGPPRPPSRVKPWVWVIPISPSVVISETAHVTRQTNSSVKVMSRQRQTTSLDVRTQVRDTLRRRIWTSMSHRNTSDAPAPAVTMTGRVWSWTLRCQSSLCWGLP